MRTWLSIAACVLGACTSAADRGGAAAAPSSPTGPQAMGLDAIASAALADAARRSGLPVTAVRVERAEAVTWRDGSLGCPRPGMAYTQALVPGYRVRIAAGERVFDYHAGRGAAPQWCPPDRAQAPLSDDARR